MGDTDREARLKAQLRANLRRRKARAREVAAAEAPERDAAEPAEPRDEDDAS